MSIICSRMGVVYLLVEFILILSCENHPVKEPPPFLDSVDSDWRIVEWQIEIPSGDDTPELQDAIVDLYIPSEVDVVQGVLIFSYAGVGETEYQHESWRQSAGANGYALMKVAVRDVFDHVTPWDFPEQSARLITRALDEMAHATGHLELGDCPIAFYGHSAGGFWVTRLIAHLSERTAGFVAFHGSLASDALFSQSVLSIPGLFLIGEYDLIWIREGSSENVKKGRAKGARWAMVVEPGTGHWDADPGRWLMIEFTETVFQRRIREKSRAWAMSLGRSSRSDCDGWAGELQHGTVFDADEQFEDHGKEVIFGATVTPCCSTRPESTRNSNWLITESFAYSWLMYELSGVLSPEK